MDKLLLKLKHMISLINPILREKYPEEDMKILRKYGAARVDKCLKFSNEKTYNIYVFDFAWRYDNQNHHTKYTTLIEETLCDVPHTGACNNQIVFKGSEDLQKAISDFNVNRDHYININKTKANNYKSFVLSCKYLEEIEAVVPLSEELREVILGKSTALTVINPELINSIKDDFKCNQ